MGNVMVDIARWLLIDSPVKTAEEVVAAAAPTGSLKPSSTKKNLTNIRRKFLDRKAFDEELRRIQPQLSSIGQDIGSWPRKRFLK